MSVELTDKKIKILQQKSSRMVQFAKDEDVNVSDYKPDIDRILKVMTRPIITNKEILTNKVIIKGELEVRVLYIPLNDDKPIHNMTSSFDIFEEINVEDIHESDDVKVTCNLEDVVAKEINTRKINIKAVGTLSIRVQSCETKAITTDIEALDIQKDTMTITCCQMNQSKSMPYKIREEITLPSESPNIYEVLWYETALYKVEPKVSTNKLDLDCIIKTSVFYLSDDASNSIQHYDSDVTYSGEIKVDGIDEDSILDVDISLINDSVSVKPDEDGEERNLLLDIETNIDLKSFKEEQIQYLDDAYLTKDELILDKETLTYQGFVCKNESLYNIKENVTLDENDLSIMQMYHVGGELYLDSMDIEDDGVLVEGALTCNILYIPSDNQTMSAIKIPLPVEYKIDISNINDNSSIHLRPYINYISCNVINDRELEVKCQVKVTALVFEENEIEDIKAAEIREVDKKEYRQMNGIIGYMVKENDRLWDIAKKYRITKENLMTLNCMEKENIARGDKLIIVKEVRV